MAAPGFGAAFAGAGGAPPPALAIPLRGPLLKSRHLRKAKMLDTLRHLRSSEVSI